MLYKKAQGMQFNWIFVIIAGAIILAFFLMFTVKYTDLQNNKVSARIANSIESQLDSLKTAEVSTTIENNAEINFQCDKFYVNNFISKGLSEKLIFSPLIIKGNLLAWTQEWNYPFSVTNVFYLIGVNDEYKYKTNIDGFGGRIPDDFTVNFVNSGQDVTITPSLDDPESGTVEINGEDYPYFGMAMAYGAIFSDDYKCLLGRSLTQLKSLAQVYSEKAKVLSVPGCDYERIGQALRNFEGNIDGYLCILNEEPNCPNIDPDMMINNIISYKKQIEAMNRDLDGDGCVVVF